MSSSRFTLRTNEATTPGRTSGCFASHDNLLTAACAVSSARSVPEAALHNAAWSPLVRNATYALSSSVTSSSSELDEKSSRSCCLLSRGFLFVGAPRTSLLSCGCSFSQPVCCGLINCWSAERDCLFLATPWGRCSTFCAADFSCPATYVRGLQASMSCCCALPVGLSFTSSICCSGPPEMSVMLTAWQLLE